MLEARKEHIGLAAVRDDLRQRVVDRESGEFEQAINVIELREDGLSWRAIAAETGVHKDTARNIYDQRNRYFDFVEIFG